MLSPLRSDIDEARLAESVRIVTAHKVELLELFKRHRIGPVWHDAIRSRPSLRRLLPTGLDQELTAELKRGTAMALLQRQLVLAASRAFDDSGICHAFYKGAQLRQLVYRPPALRPADDIDVLVYPAQRSRARGALIDAGFVDLRKPPPLTHEESFGWRGARLDLHWKLFRPGRTRFEPADEVLSHSIDVDGLSVPCLEHGAALLILATALGDHVTGRLIRAVDLHRLVQLPGFDWDRVVDFVRRLGMQPGGWATLVWVQQWLDTQVPKSVLEQLEPGRLRRRYLRAWLARDPWQLYWRSKTLTRLGFSLALQQHPSDAARAMFRRSVMR